MKQQFQTSAGSREHLQNKGEGGRHVRCARTRREPSPHQRNRVLMNICHPRCPPCHRPGVPHRSWYTGTSPGSTGRIFNEHFCVTCQLLSDQHLPSETARSLHMQMLCLPCCAPFGRCQKHSPQSMWLYPALRAHCFPHRTRTSCEKRRVEGGRGRVECC